MTPEQIVAKMRADAFALPAPPAAAAPGKRSSYGLIHEFQQSNVICTLFAAPAHLSLYFSHGGGILGGGEDQKVADDLAKILPMLAGITTNLERSDSIDPPEAGEMSFYVLTNEGRFTARIRAAPNSDRLDPIFQLYALSQGLIDRLREISAQRS